MTFVLAFLFRLLSLITCFQLIHATITYAVARTIIPGLPILIALLGTRSMYQWKSAEDHLEVMGEELYLEHMAKPVTERGATMYVLRLLLTRLKQFTDIDHLCEVASLSSKHIMWSPDATQARRPAWWRPKLPLF